MTMAESGAGMVLSRSAGGAGFLAMWQWTHSMGSAGLKRKIAGEHLIEGNAQRIEVAPGINGPVHASRLFGGHIGEGAGKNFRGFGSPGAPAACGSRCRIR